MSKTGLGCCCSPFRLQNRNLVGWELMVKNLITEVQMAPPGNSSSAPGSWPQGPSVEICVHVSPLVCFPWWQQRDECTLGGELGLTEAGVVSAERCGSGGPRRLCRTMPAVLVWHKEDCPLTLNHQDRPDALRQPLLKMAVESILER